jgi:hypothetical protein
MTLYERTAIRADLVNEEDSWSDPYFGSRPELSLLTERERLVKLLEEAAVRFGERGLGALSRMCWMASEELRDSDDDLSLSQRFLNVGSEQ